MKKFLSIIFAVYFAASSAFLPGASALLNADITRTENNFEFAKKSAEIVYLCNSDNGKSGDNSNGEALRILGRTTDTSYAFRRTGADKCVVGADGRFLLQFNDYASYKYALNMLKSDDKIVYAEPDVKVAVSSEEEGGNSYLSWGVEALGLDKYSRHVAQNNSDSQSVTVAVIDTGVEDVDFVKERLVEGYDFVENDSDAFEDTSEDSHGTFIASIICDCVGDAPVKIMPVRVLESENVYLSVVLNGIYYAVDNGADVINLSLCVTAGPCSALHDAADYAEENDVAFVVCSGNFARDTSNVCPVHIESTISVSAVDINLQFADYSCFGKEVDVCAPGTSIVGYGADGNLSNLSGTSMSAAFISAGAALFRAENPDCTASQTQFAIKEICTDLGDEGVDDYYGNGIPDFSKLIDNRFVHVTGVELADNAVTASVGDELIPDYSLLPSTATVKSVSFSSSNPSVAYVVNGKIVCTNQGSATITVTTADGGFTDKLTLVVERRDEPVPVGITVNKAPDKTKYTYKSGEALDLSGIQIVVAYSDSSTKVVDNPVGLTADGFSTASAGKQSITVEYEGFTDEFEITVGYAWWQMIIRILLLGFLWY